MFSRCRTILHNTLLVNSFGAKFQTIIVLFFNKLSIGKKFICKVERLNVKQVDPDEMAHLDLSCLQSLLLSPLAVKEVMINCLPNRLLG